MQPKSGLAWAIVWLLCILQAGAEKPTGARFAQEPPYKVEFSNSTGTKIPCSARGTPMPTIDWILADGTPVTDVLGLRQISPAGSLVFPPFKAENYRQDVHSIAYRCVASNSVGKIVSREVHVKAVMSLPYDLQVYDAYVIKGNTAALKCHFPNFIKDSVSVTAWIKDNVIKIDTPVTTDEKFTMLDDTLYIAEVTSSESGSSFRCQITNVLTGENRLSSSAGRLYVTDPQGNMAPKIIESADAIMVKEGDMLILPCVAQGFPLPDVSWSFTSVTRQIIPIKQGKTMAKTNLGLVFTKSKASDTANYMCSAQNLMGTEKKTFNVTVTASLSVKIIPQDVVLKDHGSTTLSCQVSGSPVLSITWAKNGQQILKDTLSSPSGSIEVSESGLYQCFAHNDMQMAHDVVQVNAGAEIPMATIKFTDTYLQPGSKTIIECSAKGIPLPTIKWFLDNIEVTRNHGFEITLKKEDDKILSRLKLSMVKVEDGGVYRCVVANSAGAAEQFGRLDVQGPPGIRTMNTTLAVAGKTLTIHCPYYGYPVKKVSWEKGGFSLPNDVHQIVYVNGTLVVTALQRNLDDGIYTCIVDGGKGAVIRKDVHVAVLIPPRIMPFSFQEDLLREGMRARLQCVVSEGDSPIKVHWLKNGDALPDQLGISVRYLDEFSSILTISSVTPRHNGNYTCVASNGAATVTHSAILSVNAPPKVIPFAFLDDQFFKGMRAHITCSVSQGDPPLTFRWLKDGQYLEHSLGIVIRQYDPFTSSLSIESVASIHSGNYTCTISNQAATVNHTAQLLVHVPPKIVPFSFQDDHLLEGMLVRVSCVVSRGDLPLSITWLKDELPIPAYLSVTIRDFDEYSSVLSIDPLTSYHSGNYTCRARNSAGVVQYSSALIVKVPPKWVKEPNDTAVPLGSNVLLPCQSDGYPKPVSTWMKAEDESRIKKVPIFPDGEHTIFGNGSLHISNVKKRNQGYYFCNAQNGIGKLGKMILLTVHTAPVFESTGNTTIRRTEKLSLLCKARGDPPIHFLWKVHGEAISDSRQTRYRIKTYQEANGSVSQLVINEAEMRDSTSFNCVATNAVGSNETTLSVIVKDVPQRPTDLKVSDSSNRSVAIRWSINGTGNSPITNYILQLKPAKGTWRENVSNQSSPGEETHAVVLGLRPSHTYQLRILAKNALGESEPSEQVEFVVAEEAPSAVPQDIEAIATDGNTLKMSWKPPRRDHWNGVIRGYYVGYRVTGTSEPYSFRLLEVPEDYTDKLSLAVDDLLQFTQYSVVVQAFNDGGKGPLSKDVIAITSESVPTVAPEDLRCSVLNSQTIHLTWKAPPSTAVHGVLQGYKVNYKTVGYDNYKAPFRTEIKSTSATKETLQGLHKYANYSIQVAAYTKKGDGVKSEPVFCKTLEDIPSAPDDIKVIPASYQSVLVSWKPPQQPNGAILKYNVYIENQRKVENAYTIQGNATFYEVSSLRNEKYKFSVSAFTGVGEGKRSRNIYQSPINDKIPAKIAVFDSSVTTVIDKDLKLLCTAVGIPEPTTKWISNGSPVVTGNRLHVLSDGSLLIKDIRPQDADNYTCHVENERGDDQVTYNVVVQTIPDAVVADISMATTSTLDVHWKVQRTGGSHILGYKLFYRQHDRSSWEKIELDSNFESYRIDGLQCGTKYQVYVVAINALGDSPPSDIIRTATKGGAPSVPLAENLVEEGSTFFNFILKTWGTDSCPIKYFVLEYKPLLREEWQLFSDDIQSDQRKIVLPDLIPATWYNVRMIAHTTAGTAAADYVVATLTHEGGTIQPYPAADPTIGYPFAALVDLRFLAAAAAVLVLLLISISIVLCSCRSRCGRKPTQRRGSRSSSRSRTLPRFPGREVYAENGFYPYPAYQEEQLKQRRFVINDDEVAPYATARLSDFQTNDPRYPIPMGQAGSTEILGVGYRMDQMPTAPAMSESYGPEPFYAQVNKGPSKVTATTPSRRTLPKSMSTMPPLPPAPPPLPKTSAPDVIQQKLVSSANGNVETTFIFPPPIGE